jgi:hypothetical protein
MATYNGAAFLAQQLESLACQTLRPAELVVSDDGSTDSTLAVVEKFSQTAPFPVRVLTRGARLGFGDNFLEAAQACRYPLIAFSDQDDVWLPDKLHIGAKRMDADDSLLSMHTLTVTDKALNPTGFHWDQGIKCDSTYGPLELDPFGTGWGNSMLFRSALVGLIAREARPRQPGADRRLSHDTWIYVLAAALGRVSHIAAALILYRQHGGNATGTTREERPGGLGPLVRVPIGEYREHAAFDARMAELFADLAGEAGPFATAAQTATERFDLRHAYWSSRVSVFDGPTFAERLKAFQKTRDLTREAPLWIGSRMKDLILGVAGVGSTSIGSPLLSQTMS